MLNFISIILIRHLKLSLEEWPNFDLSALFYLAFDFRLEHLFDKNKFKRGLRIHKLNEPAVILRGIERKIKMMQYILIKKPTFFQAFFIA